MTCRLIELQSCSETPRDDHDVSCPAAAAAASNDAGDGGRSAARRGGGGGRCTWMSGKLRLLPNNSALHVPAAGRGSRRTRVHHHTVSSRRIDPLATTHQCNFR